MAMLASALANLSNLSILVSLGRPNTGPRRIEKDAPAMPGLSTVPQKSNAWSTWCLYLGS